MKKKVVKCFLLLTILMFLIPLNLFAKEDVSLKTDKTYLEIGDEVTVTATLSGDRKLYAMTATLSFDQSVFEAIDGNNFVTSNDKEVIYNEKNNKFGLINKSGEISENLLTVKLKVKEDAEVGKTAISLNNISASDGQNKYSYIYSSTEVYVTRDAEEGEVIPNNNIEEIQEIKEETIKTTSTKPIIIIFSIILTLSILGCIGVNVFRIKDRKTITIILIASILISAIVVTSLLIASVNKKDVNKDGYNDYEDAKEIIKYLIDIESDRDDNSKVTFNNIVNNETPTENTTENDSNIQSNNSSTQNSGSTQNSRPSTNNGTSGQSSNQSSSSNQNTGSNQNQNTNTGSNNNGGSNQNSGSSQNEGNNQNPNTNPDNNQNPSTTPDNPNQNENKPPVVNPDEKNPSTGDNDKPGNPDYDVDNDGDVDIDDAGGSVQDTTDKTKYEVKLSEIAEANKYYFNKDEQYSLNFNAVITPNEKIEKIIIEGESEPHIVGGSYPNYDVTLKAPSTAGIFEYKISKVILSNKREIDVDLKIKKEVLKDAPYVDLFNIDAENNTFNFKLEDKDDALISGNVTILDNSGNEVLNEEINKNGNKENHFTHEFEEDVDYKILVTGNYDLDTNREDNDNGRQNLYENRDLYSHDFKVESNYEFVINNITITDVIERGQKPKITFESTNSKSFKVEYIVIDGKQYNVTSNEGNHYEISLESIDTNKFGKYTLNIDEIVLNNLKDFKNNKDYEISELSYNVLKNAPTVENINLTENKNTKTITTNYKFTDEDETIQSLSVTLSDSTGKVLDTKNIEKYGEGQTLSYGNSSDGRYTVKFIANYNLGTDRHNYTDKNIGEKEILTQADISIVSATVTKVYPQKNEPKYKVTYEVSVSEAIKQQFKDKNNVIYNVVSGVTVNGLNYDADKTSKPYTSTISFTIPNESGVIDLEATRIQLQYEDYNRNIHEFFSVAPYTIQIDVLKDKPSIQNLEIIDENYDKKEVTFKFDVVDDKGGFESGTIEFKDQIKEISKGINTIKYENVTTDETTDIKFYGDFDLDTNTIKEEENKNVYKHELIHTISYGLFEKDKYNKINITNLNAISKQNNKYFEKDELINLSFGLEGLDEDLNTSLSKVVIDNVEYDVTKNEETYSIQMNGISISGEKEILIKEIALENGKKIQLSKPVSTKIEILKDPVKIKDFTYNINENDIDIELSIQDSDKSVQGTLSEKLKVNILDEDKNELDTKPYQNKIKVNKQDGVLRYYIEVLADYDRDTDLENNLNSFQKVKILDEVISLDKNTIELKDINDITLYKENNGNTTQIEEVECKDIKNNKDNYFVKITMSNMPTLHAKIKDVIEKDETLILVLDYKYTVKENNNEQKDIRIEFGKIINGKAKNETRPETLEKLIERIKLNPSGTFKIERDLDASEYVSEDPALINVTFTGTLDGNGHTIKNLNKPLFNSLSNATIKNLKISIVRLPAENASGTIANNAKKSNIKNVLIEDFVKNSSKGNSGTLLGTASEGTVIEECKVTGFTLNTEWLAQQVGGLIGILENSTVRNTYINGKISASWNFVGGFIGNAKGNCVLENNYSRVDLYNSSANVCYGFVAGSANLTAKNNINLNILSGSYQGKFAGSIKESENNYQLVNEGEEFSQNGITPITQDKVNAELFKNAKFDESIWNLKDVSYDFLPTFNIEKVTKINVEEVGDKYDENKETLYNNLMLLMPFYNSNKIIKTAENIKEDNLLNTQELMHIIPIDENGNIVTYITSSNPGKIKKIKLIFKNNAKIEYDVRYDNTYDMVASYRISDLKIDYTYNHYIINDNSQLVNNLTNYLSSLTYEDNLDKLTPTADSRIYREFYYDETKNELKEFVLKYLSNTNYTNTTNDAVVDDYLEKEIKKDQKLEKLLYVYNYFKRFYSVSIDGIMLNDLILFGSQGFNENLTPENIASFYLSNENNFTLSRTNDAYRDTIAKYTKIDTIPDLLEYFVNELTNLEPYKWYAQEFKGYLIEINVPNRPDILYTLWDHIKYKDTHNRAVWHNYALPILTLPKDAAYIISTPTQFLIGAQRIYTSRPDTPEGQKELQDYVNKYKSRMQDYYTTAAGILHESIYFNEIHTIQIDRRFTKDINGNDVFQSPYQTQEPFHKNFNEVFGHWAHQDGNAATANGTVIYWRAEGALHGEWTYATWSHETAHNIDSRLFLKNNGRRFDAGGEDYADNNLSQRFNQNDITMNISKRYTVNDTERIASNLVPERINTPEKIKDFYEKVFDTIYIMDYLEGQAFLKLTPEEQSKLVVQVSYPNENDPKIEQDYLKHKNTVYQTVTEDQIKAMKLQTMDDLYKNRLVIYPGVIYSTIIDNRYGGEGINKVRWYQPHNDEGRPDSYSLKWLAYEMMGIGGYDGGYIEYYSNIHSTTKGEIKNYKDDLMALRAVTKQEDITFETYKKQRFDKVKDNLKYIQIINVNEYFDKLYKAMKEDAETVKQAEIKAKTDYPGESDNDVKKRNEIIANARQFAKSTEVRRELYFELKNKTNDFVAKVYDSSKPHEVKEFTISKE